MKKILIPLGIALTASACYAYSPYYDDYNSGSGWYGSYYGGYYEDCDYRYRCDRDNDWKRGDRNRVDRNYGDRDRRGNDRGDRNHGDKRDQGDRDRNRDQADRNYQARNSGGEYRR